MGYSSMVLVRRDGVGQDYFPLLLNISLEQAMTGLTPLSSLKLIVEMNWRLIWTFCTPVRLPGFGFCDHFNSEPVKIISLRRDLPAPICLLQKAIHADDPH